MDYSLKSYIQENYSDPTADEVHADLSTPVVLDDDLTKSELATFFAENPRVELRLKNFVANIPDENSPLLQVWGIANITLRLLTIPDIEINVNKVIQGISILKTANLFTEDEFEAFQPFIKNLSNKGIQTLGYLPTIEEIQQALDLVWPT